MSTNSFMASSISVLRTFMGNWLIDTPGFGWNAAFVACALAFFLSGVTAFGVDSSVPIMPTTAQPTEHV